MHGKHRRRHVVTVQRSRLHSGQLTDGLTRQAFQCQIEATNTSCILVLRGFARTKQIGADVEEQDLVQKKELDLDEILATLRRDYSKLAPRIRELQHEVKCDCAGVTLRLHFPAFRQAKATVEELVEAAWLQLMPFTLTRKEIDAVKALQSSIPVDDFILKITQLNDSAAKLFIKAQKATNRNGEAGELLLYILTEWVLSAPQFIAKMSLKTNPKMPVHGADGVHVRYCNKTSRLLLYWGESKMYSDVGAAITSAASSIAKSLQPEAMNHELGLVKRNIDFTGLDDAAKTALMRYLDPHEESYNERKDIVTCLIGFDFDGFATASSAGDASAEETFRALATEKLKAVAPKVSEALKAAGLKSQDVELFFFPLPTVHEFRNLFQSRIGWNS